MQTAAQQRRDKSSQWLRPLTPAPLYLLLTCIICIPSLTFLLPALWLQVHLCAGLRREWPGVLRELPAAAAGPEYGARWSLDRAAQQSP